MSKLAAFQPCDHLLYFVMGKFSGVFFEDGLYCFSQWRVKKTIAATFSQKGFAMLESCCVNTHTLMPAWRAENPSLTSSPVCPFTSFEAVQSSRMMRVLVPSNKNWQFLASFRPSAARK